MPSRPPRPPRAEDLDVRLDEALTETFPASDPIAVTPHRAARTKRKETGVA